LNVGIQHTKQVDLKVKVLLKKIGRHLKHIGKKTLNQNKMLKFILNKLGLNKPKLGTFKKFGEDYPKPKCSYCGKEARWLKSAGIHVNTCNNCQDKLSCLD
jgi:hypothetical protein